VKEFDDFEEEIDCRHRGEPRRLSRRAEVRYGEIEEEDLIGVVTGWPGPMWAASCSPSKARYAGEGKMTVTGNLRDVMKESISAAASYVRSRAVAFGIEPPLFDKRDIHVHVPEGATPRMVRLPVSPWSRRSSRL